MNPSPQSTKCFSSTRDFDRPRPCLIFVISSFKGVNTGIGGHYRSVREIAALLQDIAEVKVVTFGDVPSSVFDGHPSYSHVHARSLFSPRGICSLRAVIREAASRHLGPTFLISVGWILSYVAALFSSSKAARRLHMRPGGEAPKRPWVFNGVPMALFHQKDMDTFGALDSTRPLALVPGRVTPPLYDAQFLEKATHPFKYCDLLKVLCIMRIASDKRRPSALIYEGLENLRADHPHPPMAFIHCGTVQDPALYAELSAVELGMDRAFVTDPFTTGDAPKYIYGHDAFVGIGRSVIEAMALGKPCFVPVRRRSGDVKFCAITEANWRAFLAENFTHRVSYESLEQAGDVVHLEDLFKSDAVRQRLAAEARAIYDNNLSPRASLDAWRGFIDTSHPTPSYSGEIIRFAYAILLEIKRILGRIIGRMH